MGLFFVRPQCWLRRRKRDGSQAMVFDDGANKKLVGWDMQRRHTAELLLGMGLVSTNSFFNENGI
jgi:hypothetical protein